MGRADGNEALRENCKILRQVLKQVSPVGEDRQRIVESIERIKEYFDSERADVVVTEGVNPSATPLDNLKTVPLKVTYEYPMHRDNGNISPYLVTVENYPRLVGIKDGKALAIGTRPVCEKLAGLSEFLDNSQKFENEVIKVASKYTLLDFTNDHSDTFEGWQTATKQMRFYLDLLSEIKDRTGFPNFVLDLSEWLDKRQDSDESAKKFRVQLDRLSLYAPTKDPKSKPYLSTRFEEEYSDDEDSPAEKKCKDAIGELLWREFALRAQGTVTPSVEIQGVQGQFFITCGALGWAYKELWDLLNSNKHIVYCKACGGPFIATKSDAGLHQRSRCRMKMKRVREAFQE